MSDWLRGLLSVVVITHNWRQDLARTLERMLALLIVVANASAEGTQVMLQRSFPQGRTIAPDRNIGVRAAGTRCIALRDDDSGWEPGAPPRLMAWRRQLSALAAPAAPAGPAAAWPDPTDRP